MIFQEEAWKPLSLKVHLPSVFNEEGIRKLIGVVNQHWKVTLAWSIEGNKHLSVMEIIQWVDDNSLKDNHVASKICLWAEELSIHSVVRALKQYAQTIEEPTVSGSRIRREHLKHIGKIIAELEKV